MIEEISGQFKFSEKVSVVIPTYNRKDALIRCVNSVLTQDYKDFEVVIVDDNSSHAVSISWFKNSHVKIIRNTQNLKAAASRNKAICNTPADIILLLDDDCWVNDRNLIKKHVLVHRDFPRSLVGGRILNDYKSAAGKIRAMMGENGIQFNFLQTMNLSFSKATYDEIGGFNEKFEELEDVDFSQRALRKGISLKYKEDIVCYHQGIDSFYGILRRQLQYGLWAVPVRKHQRYEGHWVLPGGLISSVIMSIILPIAITLRQIQVNIYRHPMIILLTPVVWIYNVSYAFGIISYYMHEHRRG